MEVLAHVEQDFVPQGNTILLVEDADCLREILQASLEANGYIVLAAENAERALQISQTHRGQIDLLLTDLSLPKVTGTSAAKSLMEQRPGIKVLYMSGYANTTVAEMLDPGKGFLQKPFSEEELILKVREMLLMPQTVPSA